MYRQGRVLDSVEIGDTASIDNLRDTRLKDLVEWAFNEVGGDTDPGLLFECWLMCVEIVRDRRWPQAQVVRKESRAPTSPVERLAADAVCL
ncbi:hypothetical protein BZM27_53040, partial [Paraburkholderia steynii]